MVAPRSLSFSRSVTALAALAVALPLAACSDDSSRRGVAESRVVAPPATVPSARAADSHFRKTLGIEGGSDPHAGHDHGGGSDPHAGLNIPGLSGSGSGGGMGMGSVPAASSPKVTYDVPEGWTERPTTSMRAANFQVGDDPRAECYLTVLPGDAGGLAANVNRWREQIGQPPLSNTELDELMRFDFFGGRAVGIDVVGTWAGMGGTESLENWRMVGLLLVQPTGSKFLKMTGPADLLEEHLENFQVLAQSFQETKGAPRFAPQTMGSGPLPNVEAPPPGVASGLSWVAPAGWKVAAPKPFRAANYLAGDGGVECYITVLPGEAGGVLANINRWRNQMGVGPLAPAALDVLEKVPMLHGQAHFVELEGSFTDMSGLVQPSSMMLGALGTLPGRSVYVKMIGPTQAVKAQKAAFKEFCASLEVVVGG